MQENLSEILDNLLGLLLLEGSYDIEETDEAFNVSIQTNDAGKLIGFKGESLEGFQLIVNQMLAKKSGEVGFKRVILDVMGWKKQKEEQLAAQTKQWATQVLESGQEMELEPMSPWQRRIVHIVVQDMEGIDSESIGEGRDRHLVIKPAK